MERAVTTTTADGARTTVAPGAPPHQATIHALTGLRFFAALLVFFSHFPELIPIDGAAVALERQGAAGVTIFFVLSGFVLTYRYGDTFQRSPAGMSTFVRARLARIAPMNAVALIVTTVVIFLVSTTSSLLSWVLNLFMLQSLVPTKEMNSWNIPAWSVSAELVFYLVFPFFICLVLSRTRQRHLAALAAVLFAVEVVLFCAVAVLVERRMTGAGKAQVDIESALSHAKFFPGLRIWEFFLGCVVGTAFVAMRADHGGLAWLRRLDGQRVRNGCLLVAALALGTILLLPSLVDEPTSGLAAQLMSPGLYLAYTPIAVLLVAALAWGPTIVSPVLEHRWARTLGDSSYSFYLLQWAVLLVVLESGWTPHPRVWWFSALALLVLLATSVVTARLIEEPARRFVRGRH